MITVKGHEGPQHRFMGTYEIDDNRIIHGFPLYKRKRPNKQIKKNSQYSSSSSSSVNMNGDSGDVDSGGGSNRSTSSKMKNNVPIRKDFVYK